MVEHREPVLKHIEKFPEQQGINSIIAALDFVENCKETFFNPALELLSDEKNQAVTQQRN